MLEQIGHKLRRMNECSTSFADINRIKGDTVEINRELIILWLDIITFFRSQSFGKYVYCASRWFRSIHPMPRFILPIAKLE